MSAFVVEDKTINTIVGYLKRTTQTEPYRHKIKIENREEAEQLGHRLFGMNIEAIEQRYGEGQAKDFRTLDYEYKSYLPDNIVQVYKSLQCLLYQCCEGSVDNFDLYKEMTEINDQIAHILASKHPAYEHAYWG